MNIRFDFVSFVDYCITSGLLREREGSGKAAVYPIRSGHGEGYADESRAQTCYLLLYSIEAVWQLDGPVAAFQRAEYAVLPQARLSLLHPAHV